MDALTVINDTDIPRPQTSDHVSVGLWPTTGQLHSTLELSQRVPETPGSNFAGTP